MNVEEEDEGEVSEMTSLQAAEPRRGLSPLVRRLKGAPRMAVSVENLHVESEGSTFLAGIHSSAQFPPLSVVFLCLCDKVYLKQEVPFLLYLPAQIVD